MRKSMMETGFEIWSRGIDGSILMTKLLPNGTVKTYKIPKHERFKFYRDRYEFYSKYSALPL